MIGLFNFAKSIGKKVFGSEDEAPEKIKEHIEEDNPGISNLEIEVNDGVATIKGETDDPSAYEKAILTCFVSDCLVCCRMCERRSTAEFCVDYLRR